MRETLPLAQLLSLGLVSRNGNREVQHISKFCYLDFDSDALRRCKRGMLEGFKVMSEYLDFASHAAVQKRD